MDLVFPVFFGFSVIMLIGRAYIALNSLVNEDSLLIINKLNLLFSSISGIFVSWYSRVIFTLKKRNSCYFRG
ncbi:MAG: hypothetical protein ACTSVI_11850 [Promethearchaeota archaeon]